MYPLLNKVSTAKEVNNRMGFKLKEAREDARMTQQELADKSGVSRVTIALIETGAKKDVMMGTLKKLANAMGKKVSDIFFEESA